MSPIKFSFCVHNHQPVGNFDHVFEACFRNAYEPYFQILQTFPSLKTAAHFSGPLLEWIQKNHPDFFDLLRELVQAGRLELLGGGFYEPILSILPTRDAIGQLQMMNEFLERNLGAKPRGAWLTERIWEPEIPEILSAAGLEYTVVDDAHFHYAGLEEGSLDGYYITEHKGVALKVFPIQKNLRYAIPFKQPEETLALFREAVERGKTALVYADDGEKFGVWPETYQWVYEEEWLKRFFTALEENQDWLQTATFSERLDAGPPTDRVYLPPASYDEMMEWALPVSASQRLHAVKDDLQGRPDDSCSSALPFLRGGIWNNFLTKYDESNLLHKKILYVSQRVDSLPADAPEKAEALRELYQGQCNCALWHGLFGGLYLNYLRHALYRHLIAAETLVDQVMGKGPALETRDYDLDGRPEILMRQQALSAYFSPTYGGALFELDHRKGCFNLSDVLRRRPESYHHAITDHTSADDSSTPQSIHDRVRSKEEGLQNKLIYDPWRRYSFLDRFLDPGVDLENFKTCRYEELGDFAGRPYTIQPKKPNALSLQLERTARLCLPQGRETQVVVQKTFFVPNEGAFLSAHYLLSNDGDEKIDLCWGVELNLTLLAGDAPDRYYVCPGRRLQDARLISSEELKDVESFGMRDDWSGFQVNLALGSPARLWRYPVETVSQSEDGFESSYQGSCLFASWPLLLAPGDSAYFSIELSISE